jgi:hypothetical protein
MPLIIHLRVMGRGSRDPAPSFLQSTRSPRRRLSARAAARLPGSLRALLQLSAPRDISGRIHPRADAFIRARPRSPPVQTRGRRSSAPRDTFLESPSPSYLLVGCGEFLPDHGTDPSSGTPEPATAGRRQERAPHPQRWNLPAPLNETGSEPLPGDQAGLRSAHAPRLPLPGQCRECWKM